MVEGNLLPTFAIIGAQKAATTSLHWYLNEHPEIFMSAFKESNLFLADSDETGPYYELEPHFYGSSAREKRRGLTDEQILSYMFYNYRGERVIGDTSPYYTCAPSTAIETPARMYQLRPEMRIVYSLRNPLDRMVSNYVHDVQSHDSIGYPIFDDFNTRVRTRSHLLETSLYFYQLQRYLTFFPANQIHVLLFEDLIGSPDSTLAALAKFLQVDERFRFDTSVPYNSNRDSRLSNDMIFSRENFTRIIEPIKQDIAAMEDFLGRSLAIWDLSEERWCQTSAYHFPHLGTPLSSDLSLDQEGMRDSAHADRTIDSEINMSTSMLLFDFLGLEDVVRCIDIGAFLIERANTPWHRLAESGCAEVKIVGPELTTQDCKRLNASAPSHLIQYLPYAIGDGKDHVFHTTNFPAASSIYEPSSETVNIFHQLGPLMKVVKKKAISTKRLDDLSELGFVDFIKMDIRGAELLALENAIEMLKHVSVLQCTVQFVELYKGQPLFADIDLFLRSQGFCFLRFTSTAGRPFKPLFVTDNPSQSICQILLGNAVYVKDFRVRKHLDERALKSAAFVIHQFYNGYDLAHLFLQELDQRYSTTLSRDYLSFFVSGFLSTSPS